MGGGGGSEACVFIALCSVLSPYYNNFAKVTRELTVLLCALCSLRGVNWCPSSRCTGL